MLLERPVRVPTLLSSVRSALRARRRQYEVRDYLIERKRSDEKLCKSRSWKASGFWRAESRTISTICSPAFSATPAWRWNRCRPARRRSECCRT